jgi:hypothetical protein
MAVQDYARIDVAGIYNNIIALAWEAIKFPFNIWRSLPYEIKIGIVILVIMLFVIIGYYTYKNKDEWRHVSP